MLRRGYGTAEELIGKLICTEVLIVVAILLGGITEIENVSECKKADDGNSASAEES